MNIASNTAIGNVSLPQEVKEVVETLEKALFEKDQKRLDLMITNLVEENGRLGNPGEGFLFGGHWYTTLHYTPPNHPKKYLHPSLFEEGQALLNDFNEVAKEKKRLVQGLAVLLRDCKTLQGIRDALPDEARHLLPQIKDLKRTREKAWPLVNKPLQFEQYKKTEELLLFYIANRILY